MNKNVNKSSFLKILRDGIIELISAAMDFAVSRLKKPGVDNAKVLADAEEALSRAQKNTAEARKIWAEAGTLELKIPVPGYIPPSGSY